MYNNKTLQQSGTQATESQDMSNTDNTRLEISSMNPLVNPIRNVIDKERN